MMNVAVRGVRLSVALAVFSMTGCSKPATQAALEPVPAGAELETIVLLPIDRRMQDFTMRQKIVGEFEGRSIRFEAVVQKKADRLQILGLTPFGTKAFVLRQRGQSYVFESFLPGELPFPPAYILEDFHRCFLWDSVLPWGKQGQEGESVAQVRGEWVRESWHAGRLRSRQFVKGESRALPPMIEVRYEGGMKGGSPPAEVTLRHQKRGYTLHIETAEFRVLERSGGSTYPRAETLDSLRASP